jgi:hypothetical protein
MILDVILAVVAIAASIYAYLVSRAMAKYRLGKRPLVIWDDKHISSDLNAQYGLFFKNVSPSPAINVAIPKEYLDQYKFLSAWNEIRREMAPGGETMCARGPVRFTPFIKKLIVTYDDPNGVHYSTILQDGKIRFDLAKP